MAKDLGDTIGAAVGKVVRETVETTRKQTKNGALSGPKGLAAGAGLAMLAPLAGKGVGKLVGRGMSGGAGVVKKAQDTVGDGLKDAVGKTVDKAGGAGGLAKEAGKSMIPGAGDGKSEGQEGVGKGRRMPIQQAVDVAVPVKTAYNEWTQFEEWPKFMQRLDSVSQEDECHVRFKTKIWGKSKEFLAEIVEQRPDERIKWKVTQGVSHTGVVTFHELAPRLTRIEVTIDVQPGSLIEKAARGMRHVKRAVRADLHRFKAYIEMEEQEDGAWRGEIEDGEVKSKPRAKSSSSSSKRSSASKRPSSSRSSSSSSKRSSSSGRTKAASSGSRSRSASSRSSGSSNGRSRSSDGSSSSSARSSSSNGGKSGSTRRKTSGSRS